MLRRRKGWLVLGEGALPADLRRLAASMAEQGFGTEVADDDRCYAVDPARRDAITAPFSGRAQAREPVQVGTGGWVFHGHLYETDEPLDADAVRERLLGPGRRRRARAEAGAARLAAAAGTPGDRRAPIPDVVKLFVWGRDGGRCVGCGSTRELEFDHVIPLALGGSDTPGNVQVLCRRCNRRKGSRLALRPARRRAPATPGPPRRGAAPRPARRSR